MPRMFTGRAASVNAPETRSSTIGHFLTRLLPATCCLCGAKGMAAGLDICLICREALPIAPPPDSFPLFSRVVVPFRYAFPIDHCIKALKFRGDRVYARVLGRLLADARRAIDAPWPDVVVPVALHPARYRERGFNQARELARYVPGRVDTRCLIRVVDTREQSSLPWAERQTNVQGAFAIQRPLPRGCRVALIDDVITTGSTALEAAAMLQTAGAADIELWAVASTPKRAHEEAML